MKDKDETANAAALRQRADELQRVIDAPTEKERAARELAEIEARLASEREGEARASADQRMVAIKRAYGSVIASLADDEGRIRECLVQLTEAIERINARYGQAVHLKAEAAALADRFGLRAPDLVNAVSPLHRVQIAPKAVPAGPASRRPKTEHCEHRMRERRDYSEIAGSPGYEIIQRAGLKPYPPLNERQQRSVDQVARENSEARRQLAELPQIPTEGPYSIPSI